MEKTSLVNGIKDKIHNIRNQQVILDRDLAKLYGVETRVLKQAVNRNKKRFPFDFMFILTKNEIEIMVSQNVIPSKQHLGGSLPFAFTEQGVANLSNILNSDKAIEINIQIMRAFVQMRKFISKNVELFQRIDRTEQKLLEYDNKFKEVFNALETKPPGKGIFFNGQVFDAYTFVSDIVRSAKKSIILVDNYIDDTILTLFSKRNKGVKVTIYTKQITKQIKLDLNKYNSQYQKIEIKEFKDAHDRFLIIDGEDIFHIGASLKDLGKKWFAFSKFKPESYNIMEKLK